jgi:hypothetical protein
MFVKKIDKIMVWFHIEGPFVYLEIGTWNGSRWNDRSIYSSNDQPDYF